ncbi:uncharacterized protein KY384_007584 [Bacidia gigantensis]|uniref:uncharacterized protein n=1 Tax=Bacidia gigantensis TaxID=2732470 RepID=UPI001D040D1A|nr:uncharacterized protein KY384_007584 [Bacidia gigantensis]KAG8527432.1 hypothetical protein KY384_007584 [Bacidia gigantensis]
MEKVERAHYSPPWADTSIIGVAGSSGSGKTSLAVEIVSALNLPWVVILSMDSFYKALTPEENAKAHQNEFDFDAPQAIDFDLLTEKLRDIKAGRLMNGEPDIIVPRGIQNRVAIDMVVGRIRQTLEEKSRRHQADLEHLGKQAEDEPLSGNVAIVNHTIQVKGMSTILQDPLTDDVDFIFYLDRLTTILIEQALEHTHFASFEVETPQGKHYHGVRSTGEVSAVVILRGGSCMETGLRRVIPECKAGRMLIQSSYRTGEPELHFLKLPADIARHDVVMLLDPQMSSGGAALMAVKVLVDHGVEEENVVFVTMFAGRMGVMRLLRVFPGVRTVVVELGEDGVERWVEKRYFGC